MKIVTKSVEVGGRTLSLEVGRFAEQATAAVLARYGDTMVIATVTASAEETKLDYFPLSVEYVERLYAGGRIKGSRWVKREGRPTDDAVLSGRLIDRSIRPLFDKNYKHDVQVVVTVLSVDGDNSPDVLGIVAASAALAISPLPWKGPVGAVRVGHLKHTDGKTEYFANPTSKEAPLSEMDLIVSGNADRVLMLEAGANQVSEDVMIGGILFAKKEAAAIINTINELVKEVGQTKIVVEKDDKTEELKKLLAEYKQQIQDAIAARVSKENGSNHLKLIAKEFVEKNEGKYDEKEVETVLDYMMKQQIRDTIMEKGIRADGRDIKTIRPISIDVGVLPRTHGTGVFQRGQTQVLTVATLGAPSMGQLLESPEGETEKRYIHHYNFPPYSVGETGRVGFTNRREIGHGALAERALIPVLPPQDVFPYTIRLVSEVMSSNGSTSMASTCGSTLALMDAGVPITEPVAGLAIGLMTKGDKYVILTDIIGLEDFGGDMDFKVTGTKKGITAIQMDTKIDGLSDDMIRDTFERAKEGRLFILEKMLAVLPAPRATISQYAPKVAMLKVPTEKIGEIIGPGGKNIRLIQSETSCDINIDDDGSVTITGIDPEKVDMAFRWVSGIVKDVMPGEEYEGVVKRILNFGAFVEILPGKEGLVHVSQMSTEFVSDPSAVVSIGQPVHVRVLEIDQQGRINLSMLFGEDAEKRPPQPRGERPDRGGDRGGRGGFGGGRGGNRGGGRGRF